MENKKPAKPKNTVNGGLYIALAICILSVICVGVYSAIINIFKSDTPGVIDDGPIVVDENDKSFLPPRKSEAEEKKSEKTPVSVEKDEENKDIEVNAEPYPTSFTRPVSGAVAKEFSLDVLVYSETMNDYRTHTGIDFEATLGESVKCFANGKITEIYEDPLMGETVIVSHNGELCSVYSNLSAEIPEGISVGSEVNEGDIIGCVGETCLIECEQAPHLHFEVIKNGVNEDPMQYLD